MKYFLPIVILIMFFIGKTKYESLRTERSVLVQEMYDSYKRYENDLELEYTLRQQRKVDILAWQRGIVLSSGTIFFMDRMTLNDFDNSFGGKYLHFIEGVVN